MNNKAFKYIVIIILVFILIFTVLMPILLCSSIFSFNTSIPLHGMSGSGEGGYGGSGGVVGKDCAKILIQKANNKVSDAEAENYINLVNKYANQFGVDPAIMMALIEQESAFNPNAGSSAGAVGLTQLMPGTAAGLEVTNRKDPEQSIMGGTKYLSEQYKRFKSYELALAAYNAGPGAVQKYGGIPEYKETQNYVAKIMNERYPKYKKCLESISSVPTSGLSGNFYPLGKGYPLEDPFTGGRQFGADRNDGRLHAGVDLIANTGAKVYAIKDGKIVNYIDEFTGPPDLNITSTILVDHGDYVANYGEVSNMASGLKIGSEVKAGQVIGNVGQVSSSAMLHFELYTPGTIKNEAWYKNKQRPKNLLDPTNLLKSLQDNKVE